MRSFILGVAAFSMLFLPSLVRGTESELLLLDGDRLTIAFGSCNRQGSPQPLWEDILREQPALWIWLGDNIYGDTEDMDVMRERYDINKNQPGYVALRGIARIHGTWDDHDYGANDAGKEYPKKHESKLEFLRFLDFPENHPIRGHEGIYHHADYVLPGGFRLRIVLPDTRTFRDPIERVKPEDRRWAYYLPNHEGTMLGEDQWRWLEEVLDGEAFDFCILGSSIQLIAEEHDFEKWANFPGERQRLIELIDQQCPGKVIVISGDRHHSEISAILLPQSGSRLVDATSSGLNRPGGFPDEPNRHRVGAFNQFINYGILELDLAKHSATVSIRGMGGEIISETTQRIAD